MSQAAAEAVTLISAPNPTRSGEDSRRRGWFWHWNSIVTQYAPLIGLKGVGLLNSYTVWTDRREESPHRGYAFPSQQREADFYGEDRAELITINKLLVALDLIEIRKEMVLRVDEQGRRWKVPHNFYRVKDHSDNTSLTSRDVLRVAELADKDAAVYRYVRRVFSAKFSPIDRDNVWSQILDEVRDTAVWRRLSERTAKDEARASERTRAGHANRKPALFLPADGDNPASVSTLNNSGTVSEHVGAPTSVASSNNGSELDVAPGNNGLKPDSTTDVGPANDAGGTDVVLTNTTYHQDGLTTTTTTPDRQKTLDLSQNRGVRDTPGSPSHRPVTSSDKLVTGDRGVGPDRHGAPADAPGEAMGVRAFEDANGRVASPAERTILRQLAERFDTPARTRGDERLATGWEWVRAAIYEAVESGSAFVAPRRVREILTRWERDGLPAPVDVGRTEASAKIDSRADLVIDEIASRDSGPDIPLPHGFGSRRTWAYTLSLLSSVLDGAILSELTAGTSIAGMRGDEVTITTGSAAQADRLAGEYRVLVERKLSQAMRMPVRIAVLAPDDAPTPLTGDAPEPSAVANGDLSAPVFLIEECGLPSTQVWAAVIEDLVASGAVSRANVDAWLRSTRLVGRLDDGSLVIGAAHALALRRIESRFSGELRASAAKVIGRRNALRFVVTRDWLAGRVDLAIDEPEQEFGAA